MYKRTKFENEECDLKASELKQSASKCDLCEAEEAGKRDSGAGSLEWGQGNGVVTDLVINL